MNAPAVSLDQLPTDATGVVQQLRGGGELVHRLAAMGLTVGARLVVLQNTGHGPMPAIGLAKGLSAVLRSAPTAVAAWSASCLAASQRGARLSTVPVLLIPS